MCWNDGCSVIAAVPWELKGCLPSELQMAYMGQCTLDANAKQYFNNTGIRLENNIWGSASPSSSGAIKPDLKAHSGVMVYKPATSKAVKKGMVIEQ